MNKPPFRPCPPISQELLDHLRMVFPLKPPAITESDREIWVKAGQQRLIEWLENQFEIQNKG